jgi:hypothetical protein
MEHTSMTGERLALVASLALSAIAYGAVKQQAQLSVPEFAVLLLIAEAVPGAVLYWRERVWRKRIAIQSQETEFYKDAWISEQRKSDALVKVLLERGFLAESDVSLIEAVQDEGLRLVRDMRGKFGLSDLRTLAFDVGIEWENVTGDTLDTKLVGLVTAAKRGGKLGRLAEVAERYRSK